MFFNRTVLLADDRSTDRAELHQIFKQAGCVVMGEVSTTDDLLFKYDQLKPDVVVIDATLGGTLDALVVIRRLARASPGMPIFATGMGSQSGVLMEALSMGATDFFTKPFLARSVHQCLQRNL